MQIFGGLGQASAAKASAMASQQVAQLEMKVNDQRRQAMELSANRQQLEIYRNNQRLRAQATQAAVSQGASRGSGLQGGLAQVNDQSMWNGLGVNQNLEIGRNIFGLNDRISQQKALISGYQSQAATSAGISNLGSAVMGSAKFGSALYGYATAPQGPITIGTSQGPTPFTSPFSNYGS